MTDIFQANDPMSLTRRWVDEARETEINDPDAVALATVDAQGMPNTRVVLMRQIEDNAFVFYTNHDSVKGIEMDGAGKAAFVYHWKSLRRQIRVRGLVTREDGAIADAYYAQRPLGSRHGAWASQQSQPLDSRETLIARVAEAEKTHGDTPKRPPNWGGYRITPLEIEFWADGEFRLHDRFLWQRVDISSQWTKQRLYP